MIKTNSYKVIVLTKANRDTFVVFKRPTKRELRLGWDRTLYFEDQEGEQWSYPAREVVQVLVSPIPIEYPL